MSQTLAITIKFLTKTRNEAASAVLIAALDCPDLAMSYALVLGDWLHGLLAGLTLAACLIAPAWAQEMGWVAHRG